MLSRCLFDFSVGVAAFVMGLSRISSPFFLTLYISNDYFNDDNVLFPQKR